jgi:hypothetical protein
VILSLDRLKLGVSCTDSTEGILTYRDGRRVIAIRLDGVVTAQSAGWTERRFRPRIERLDLEHRAVSLTRDDRRC